MLIDERLAAIEARLEILERSQRPEPEPAALQAAVPPASGLETAALPPESAPATVDPTFSAPVVLGWTGAAALVLAAAYMVRLGIAYGWITAPIQVAAAAALGLAMVGGGLALRARDRRYASLLAAGGVAVLYLTIFGGHLHHHLFGPLVATALLVAVAALSLVLHAVYREGLFVAFALAGSYATPLLVHGQGGIGELAIYLVVWNLVYSAYALSTGRRAVYLAALYASLLVFELARMDLGSSGWRVAAAFQLAQFVLFTIVAVGVSVRTGHPMNQAQALAHFPALLLFYAIEYGILHDHVPAAAPWMAVGFVVAAYAAYGAAGTLLGESPGASRTLIHSFGAIVLATAVFWDAVPEPWRPLAGLVIAVSIGALWRSAPRIRPGFWPYLTAAGVVYVIGTAILFDSRPAETIVGLVPLAFAYPALVYALYFSRPIVSEVPPRLLLLALAHLQLLAACDLVIDRWLDEPETTIARLWLSLAWAVIGVAFLAAASRRRDRLLARSSLGIFALFAGKVLFFDLSEAAPLVRVGCLVVLGLSLYAGGWIYRRVLAPAGPARIVPGVEVSPFANR